MIHLGGLATGLLIRLGRASGGPSVISLGELWLLVVVDDPDDVLPFRDYVREALQDVGFHLDDASSPAQALSHLAACCYDVIVIDCRLGPQSGIDLVREIRSREIDQPVILLTDVRDELVAVEAMQAAATDCLVKSALGPSVVASAIRHAVAASQNAAQRRHADAALRDAEARYRILFEQSPYGVLLMDVATGGAIEMNDVACRQLGYTREEFSALRISDYEASETPEETTEHIDKIVREGSDEFETLHRTKSGELRNVQVWAKTLPFAGRIVLYAIFQDITERKRAEQGLRLFRSFIDHSNDAFEVLEVDERRFVDLNDRACRDLGYTREEYLSLSVFDIDPSVDPANCRALAARQQGDFSKVVDEIRRSGFMMWEGIRRRKDGSTFPVEVAVRHVQLEREYLVTAVRDISERKLTEDALRHDSDTQAAIAAILRLALQDLALDDMLQQVLQLTLSIPWLSVERRGAILLAGDEPGALLMRAEVGLSDETKLRCARVPLGVCLCGRAAASGQLVHAAHVNAEHVNAEHEITIAGGPPHGHYCVPISYGNEVLGLLNVYLEAGHACSRHEQDFLLSVADTLAGVLARRRVEAQKLRAMEQLQKAQKMDAIGNLVGGVAHDFNNLLCVILAFSGFALEGLREGDPLRDDLKEVRKAAERAAALARRILTFSRTQLVQRVPLSLNQSVTAIEKMLGRIIGEDIELVQALAPDLGAVLADPGEVDQVIMNLAANARDAMSSGGRCTIGTANVELGGDAALQLQVKPGPYSLLTVADTGCGMDGQTLARIFEPFFTTKEKGTGLGLAAVYGIVTQSGGTIAVDSEVGRGTTFRIYLPRALAEDTRAPRAPGPPAHRGGTETILVVEDDEAMLNVATRTLSAAGYTVLAALNGGEALLACESHAGPIHLMLTDVVMPRMNGDALAERLAQVRPELKPLFMSGYAATAVAQLGALGPSAPFIAKPFSPTELALKVREVLDHER